MEHKIRVIPPEQLMGQLPELLEEAEFVPLIITGNSMAPFLRHGRDTVYLSKVTQPPKKGDMILYRRDSGGYALHRIYRERNGMYDLVGDGQCGIEHGIRNDQILAAVQTVRRKGKLLRKGSFLWEFFEHDWLALLPLRPGIARLHGWMTAWRKRK